MNPYLAFMLIAVALIIVEIVAFVHDRPAIGYACMIALLVNLAANITYYLSEGTS